MSEYDATPPPYPSYPGDSAAPMPPAAAPYGAPPIQPAGQYASWIKRVAASLIDGLLTFAIMVIPLGIGVALLVTSLSTTTDLDGYTTTEVTNSGALAVGIIIMVVGFLLAFAFGIWNTVFRQGRTGQTIGKKALNIRVVRLDNGQFMGTGTAFLRWIMAYLLGNLCFLDYLWPLWDDRKQTWHDKVVGTVVID